MNEREGGNVGWVEKMREGMRMCIDACHENGDWTECDKSCPFNRWCDALMEAEVIDPLIGLEG